MLFVPIFARAQMTIGGQVTNATGVPVRGASVSISELKVGANTDAEGRYNFLIRGADIRGQTVALVARHSRFGAQTVRIQIVGGTLVQNFVLARTELPDTPDLRPVAARSDSASERQFAIQTNPPEALEDPGGPVDLPGALAGKRPGLNVTNGSGAGTSAPMLFRGPRSFSGNIQPLVVVDGVPVDNQPFTTTAQRFGLGGFDYGTPLDDIALDDIATYQLLDPATATILYGSRAANGVVRITTKSGREVTGFHVAVQQRFTLESPIRLPRYQNSYGQGLGGAFEFFDGQGGGVNDGIAESWGPKLDGTPIAQASLSEARRPDVRYWLPRPDAVRDYFGGARTIDASAVLLGSNEWSNLRAAINVRDVNGLTPDASLRRLGFTLGGAAQPTRRLLATLNVQYSGSSADDRPGTGFDEVNPVAGFTRIGRQVDIGALRNQLRDDAGEPINWIYTARNNPFFATAENSNDDKRTHIIGGAGLTIMLTSWLNATLRGGTDDHSGTRQVAVARGWKGGYPTTLGRGNFAGGGSDRLSVSAAERLGDLAFQTNTSGVLGFALSTTAGAAIRSSDFETEAVVTDRPSSGTATISSLAQSAKHDVTSFYLAGSASRQDYFQLMAGARLDQSTSLAKAYSALFPSVSVSYDLARTMDALPRSVGLERAELHASWWSAGNEITGRTLAQMYFGGGTPVAPGDAIAEPERTTGLQLGTRLGSANELFGFDLTAYRERSSQLVVATPVLDGSALVSQTGEIFNSGFEMTVRSKPLRGDDLSWEIAASHARNTSTVDALREGTFEAPLSPSLFGAGLTARIGSPVGAIMGTRYLRNAATGSLILRNGLPIADASSPFTVFGSWQPDWTGSFQSRLRCLGAELFVLFDVRVGGKVFSATNMWGSFAGTLESTVAGREDSLLIAGTDSTTGAANATKVSPQDYFHAIGAIHEPWVYDATSMKLREARLSYEVPSRFLPGFREHRLRASLIGRNLLTRAKAPNIDPETALSAGVFQGFEMGQLPSSRSLGLQISITP